VTRDAVYTRGQGIPGVTLGAQQAGFVNGGDDPFPPVAARDALGKSRLSARDCPADPVEQ